TRIVAGSSHTARQQVVRIDRGAPFVADRALQRRLLDAALAASPRAVVLSDYGYDSVTPALAARPLGAWRRGGVIVGLDARYRLARYRGVTLATPNESEAAAAAGFPIAGDEDLARAAARLRRQLGAPYLLV